MITKRHWVAIAVLGITVSAVWYYSMAQLDGQKQLYARRLLPSEVGGWSGVDLPVSKPVTDTLRTTDESDQGQEHERSYQDDHYGDGSGRRAGDGGGTLTLQGSNAAYVSLRDACIAVAPRGDGFGRECCKQSTCMFKKSDSSVTSCLSTS